MDKLDFIKNQMNEIGIPYNFLEWTEEVPNTYWVGEYSEIPTVTEDGNKKSSFILTGTTWDSWLALEEDKQKIENHFSALGGLRGETESGVIVIFYSNAIPVPTGVADLKRIQVNLDIEEWKAR